MKMKLFYAFAMAAMFATSALATDTVMFDGCAAVKVDGTNYYAFVDPHCVTGLEAGTSKDTGTSDFVAN